jgi:hypothetical protein
LLSTTLRRRLLRRPLGRPLLRFTLQLLGYR